MPRPDVRGSWRRGAIGREWDQSPEAAGAIATRTSHTERRQHTHALKNKSIDRRSRMCIDGSATSPHVIHASVGSDEGRGLKSRAIRATPASRTDVMGSPVERSLDRSPPRGLCMWTPGVLTPGRGRGEHLVSRIRAFLNAGWIGSPRGQ